MFTATKTVTINAAFLKEIKDDDVQFGMLLNEALGVCQTRTASEIKPNRLATILSELRDQIAIRFALEEAFGYFEDPLSVAPRLSDKVLSLRDQHSELYEEITGLAEAAADIAANNLRFEVRVRMIRKLVSSVVDFHRRLQAHEAAEIQLILDAYYVDIGGDE